LHILLPKTADHWVRKSNTAGIFGGRSALDRMTSGNVADLYVVASIWMRSAVDDGHPDSKDRMAPLLPDRARAGFHPSISLKLSPILPTLRQSFRLRR